MRRHSGIEGGISLTELRTRWVKERSIPDMLITLFVRSSKSSLSLALARTIEA